MILPCLMTSGDFNPRSLRNFITSKLVARWPKNIAVDVPPMTTRSSCSAETKTVAVVSVNSINVCEEL